jgi:hypothetical protein
MAIALRLVLLCLLVSVSIFAQEADQKPTEPRKCTTEVKYDRFKDETTELCGNLVLESVREGTTAEIFSINSSVSYSGTVRRKPISVQLNILNVQMQSGVAKPRFSQATELFLLTGTQRIVLPLQRKGLPTVEVKLTAEALWVTLTKPFVEALVAARSVEGRLGSKEFQFDEAELRQVQRFLKELLPLLTPSTPNRKR